MKRLLPLAILALAGCSYSKHAFMPGGAVLTDRPAVGSNDAEALDTRHSKSASQSAESTFPEPLPLSPRPRRWPTEQRLDNGVRIILLANDEFPSASCSYILDRGAASAALGVAELYELGLFGASRDFPAHDLNDYFHYVGAGVKKWTTSDGVGFGVTALSPLIGGPSSRVASMFTTPLFESEELASDKVHLRNHMARRRANANDVAAAMLASMLFSKDHPYGRSPYPSDAQIEGLSSANLERFRDTYVSGEHLSVVAMGAIDPAKTVRRLSQDLGGIPRKSPLADGTIPPLPAAPTHVNVLVLQRSGASQSNLAIGFATPPAADEAHAELALLESVLGRSLSGRLNRSTRGRHGQTYGVHVSSEPSLLAGIFRVATSVDTPRTADTIRDLLTELRKIRVEAMTASELTRAKVHATGRAWSLEPNAESSWSLAALATSGLPIDHYEKLARRIESASADDVRKTAERILDVDAVQIAIVGDANVIAPELRALGVGDVTVINEW